MCRRGYGIFGRWEQLKGVGSGVPRRVAMIHPDLRGVKTDCKN